MYKQTWLDDLIPGEINTINFAFKNKEEFKMNKEQVISKLNELLGEDVTEQFEDEEERAAVNGNMEFLVSNEKGLAVQVINNYDEEEDTTSYSIDEEWVSK